MPHPFVLRIATIFVGLLIATVGYAQSLRWTPLGPFSGVYDDLTLDSGGTIYARRWNGGVIRSLENGTSWTLAGTMQTSFLTPTTLLGAGRDTAYLVGEQLYRTTDRGDSWEQLFVRDDEPIYSIAVGKGGEVYAAAGEWCVQTSQGLLCHSPDSIYVSLDGTTWRATGIAPNSFRLLGCVDDGAIIGSGNGTLLRSSDSGNSWSVVIPARQGRNVMPRYFEKGPANRYYVFAGDGVVYRSTDNGKEWITTGELKGAGRGITVMDIAVDRPGAILASLGDRRVLRSVDEGLNWDTVHLQGTVSTMLPLSGGDVIACMLGDDMVRTIDRFATWNRIGNSLPGIETFYVAATSSRSICVGLGVGAYLRGDLYGDSVAWSPFDLRPEPRVCRLHDTLLGFTQNGLFYISTDYGASWDSSASAPPNTLFGGLVSIGGEIYAFESAVWRTSNRGLGWERLDTLFDRGVSAIARDSTGRLLIAAGGMIYRFDASEHRWAFLSAAVATSQSVTRMVVAPDGTIVIGTSKSGVRRSTDNGETWSDVGDGPLRRSIAAIVADRSGALAATDSGVYITRDAGVTWGRTGEEVWFPVYDLDIAADGTTYAATQFGVYASDWSVASMSRPIDSRGEASFTIVPNPSSDIATICVRLDRPTSVRLALATTSGEIVRVVASESMAAGEHRIACDLTGLPVGIYAAVLWIDGQSHVIPLARN